ncbi:DUF6150 family protein [Dyella sp. 2RAB6]|uniref:DUF6150 family protein n=1 Tax=Dyella sp. 2RAB6 TaxID=3232992 RepID=UPI003F91D3AB
MARIYVTETMGEAEVRVALVSARGIADLWVCRVSSWGLAVGDERWFFTPDRQSATKRVFFTSQGMAQITVCFVATLGEAGWRDPARARPGLFSR